MADFSQRTTTENVTRHEWRLTLPSNWVELDKLLHSEGVRRGRGVEVR
jgi:hypothetical protein